MAHTDDDTVLALAIRDIVEANKATLLLDDVLYGRHLLIPRASAAVVTPGGKRRTLAGVSGPGGRTQTSMVVEIAMHWSKVGDEETERKAVDARATALERKLHEDVTVGGIIIHGFIVSVDRGETQMANSGMFRSVAMIFEGMTKTYLSPPAAPA